MNLYDVRVTRVVDGDTFYGDILLKDFNMEIKDQKFRLIGIDTPERGKPGFYEATEYTAQAIEEREVQVVLHSKDDFGRHLVDVYTEIDSFETLNDNLLLDGLAVVYQK
jgi:micrococcal nuclease